MKTWLIISWRHMDHMDGAYGQLLDTFHGTRENAEIEARSWNKNYKPIGIMEEVEPD